MHAADSDFAAAIACYEQALANQLTLGRVRAAAASVNDIAAVYYQQGRHTEALAQFRRATDMVRQEPGPGWASVSRITGCSKGVAGPRQKCANCQ